MSIDERVQFIKDNQCYIENIYDFRIKDIETIDVFNMIQLILINNETVVRFFAYSYFIGSIQQKYKDLYIKIRKNKIKQIIYGEEA